METERGRYKVVFEGVRSGRFTVLDLTTHEAATQHGKPLTGLSHSSADALADGMNLRGRQTDPIIGVPKRL